MKKRKTSSSSSSSSSERMTVKKTTKASKRKMERKTEKERGVLALENLADSMEGLVSKFHDCYAGDQIDDGYDDTNSNGDADHQGDVDRTLGGCRRRHHRLLCLQQQVKWLRHLVQVIWRLSNVLCVQDQSQFEPVNVCLWLINVRTVQKSVFLFLLTPSKFYVHIRPIS